MIVDHHLAYDATVTSPFKFWGYIGKLLKEIFSPLKVTISIKVVPHESFTINEDGTNIGSSLRGILNGTFDLSATMHFQRFFGDFWKNELNGFYRAGICYAVADKTEDRSKYFEQNFFLHIFVLVMYTFLVTEEIILHTSKKYKIKIAMDLLRASIGNATLWEPKTSFKQIIFMMIIFPFIIITSFLQSELTSIFTTTPKEELIIEKIDDLIKNNYEVFTPNDYRQYFHSTPYYNQIRVFKYAKECYEPLKNNFLRACAHDCFFLKNLAPPPEYVKILEDVYLKGYYTYTFPVDYPLLPRIRKIYYRLFEGGIIINIFKQYERRKILKNETIYNITFNELGYIYVLLSPIWICVFYSCICD